MSMKPFSLEWLIMIKKRTQRVIHVIVRTVTGALPLSWQNGLGDNLIKCEIDPYLAQNAITVNGKLYKVADGVTILDSVTTAGNTYFNLGIKPTDNMEVEAEIIPTGSAVGTLMGSGTSDNDLVCFFNQRDADTFRNIYGAHPRKAVEIDIFNFVNQRIMYKAVVTPTEQTTYINDSLVDTSTFTASGNNVDMYLLGRKFGGSFGSAFVGSLCTISIKINGADVYKLFAAQKNNVVGVYDLISGQFIAPTVGTLTAGKATKTINVHQEIPAERYQEVEYIENPSTGTDTSILTGVGDVDRIEASFYPTQWSFFGCVWSNYLTESNDNSVRIIYTDARDSTTLYTNMNSKPSACLTVNNGITMNAWNEIVLYEQNDKEYYQNGSVSGEKTKVTASANTSQIVLFNKATVVKRPGYGRYRHWKAYKSGVAVADLYPVKRLSDNQYGMYDLVTGTFKGNAGTAASLTGGSARQMEVPICTVERSGDLCNLHGEIPYDEYEEVEYIQSSGTQYIDTGLILDGETTVDIDYMLLSNIQDKSLFGVWYNNSPKHIWQVTSYNNRFYFGINSTSEKNAGVTDKYVLHSLKAIASNATYSLIVDGTTIASGTDSLATVSDMSCYLFCRNASSASGAQCLMDGNIYSFKVTKSGNIALNLIPVKRRSDNKYGMYDLVSRTFFGNNGTGDFTGGEPVTGYECRLTTSCQGRVDMGTLNWTFYPSDPRFYATISDMKLVTGRGISDIFCEDYKPSSSGENGTMFHNAQTIIVYDSRFTDTAAFKAAMSGKYLYYQRSTDNSFVMPQTIKIFSDLLQGSIDAVSGLETEEYLHEVIDSNSVFTKNSGVDGLFHHAVVGAATHSSPPYNIGFCNLFTMANKAAANLSDWECTMNGSSGSNGRISFKAPAGMFSTADEFKQFAIDIGLEFWTDKATPTQSQGTAHTIQGYTGLVTMECRQSRTGTVKYNSRSVTV